MDVPAIAILSLRYASWFFFALLLFGGVFRLAELASASSKVRKYAHSLHTVDYRRFQDSEHIMPVSLILPATEETEPLTNCVKNLLSLEFRQYELIVVADSRNETSWLSLCEGYNLLPFRQPYKKTLKSGEIEGVYRSAKDVRLVVLDQRGGSRADALNAGVNVSSYPIVATVYPRQRLTKNALLKTVYAFVGDSACLYIGSFPRVGVVDVAAPKKQAALAEYQAIERLRLLYTHPLGHRELGVYLPAQTAFAAFLKSAVLEEGGFSGKTKAEQADLLLRMHARHRKGKNAYCARLLPDAICYEAPKESMRAVCTDRGRAQRAMNGALRRNRRLPKQRSGLAYTRLAETGWPLAQLLGFAAVLAAAILGAASYWFLLFYLLLGALLGALQSAGAVLLEENAFQLTTDTGLLLRRYLLAVIENFGYRQRVAFARLFVRR
ncbi:MAG: glycosyltransferase family 2 protein [Clostridiales bacterium]|nr:glycosyltransferase family 2 protein [Clostridiales bacterium]